MRSESRLIDNINESIEKAPENWFYYYILLTMGLGYELPEPTE